MKRKKEKAKVEPTLAMALQQEAIKDAVLKGLKATPVYLNGFYDYKVIAFMMDGEVFLEHAAVDHILGKYSWYKKGP